MKILARFTLVLLLFCWAGAGPALAQAPIRYNLSFPNAVHHEAQISVTFPDLPAGVFSVRMARSSPGRYALHEFAKNVYLVKAFDGTGKELKLTRPDPHQWDVAGHNGTVTFTYTLFGDRGDGTYAQIDGQHAHLNLPATLLYGLGLENRPAEISFTLPAGKNWQVATQLKKENAPSTFSAPNLQYLMDSPVEIAPLQVREWTVSGRGRNQTIRIALHSPSSAADLENFTAQAKRVVAEAGAVFGTFPDFDFNSYTFLACYVPQASGDGMEHRNSTYLTSSLPLAADPGGHLATLSHEFFHAWNVERIRPRTLEPFNFAEANMSGELWFAEGFTTYYGDLLLCRSQVLTPRDYARNLGEGLNHVLNSPGHRFYSPVEMSYQAPFVDAARSIDPVNRQNTYISYYPFGSVVALALDLSLRTKFKNLTLDHYMQAVWKALGQPEKPYILSDLEQILGQVTKNPAFAADFFHRHVHGKELADYKTLLAPAGFLLRKKNAGKASLHYSGFGTRNGQLMLNSGTLAGSPLYQAGLDREDVLVSLNNQAVASVQDVSRVISTLQPGAVVPLTFIQRGEPKTASVSLVEDPTLEVVLYEEANLPVTKQIRAFREYWLGRKAGQ